MDLSQETEDFLGESIEHTLGLSVSTQTLQLKLRASEEAQHHLRNQYLSIQSKLKERDEAVERARAEASMSAQTLKKFVDENQKLAVECMNLLEHCKKLEKECSLYDDDREALMEFGNEAHERGKEAEARVIELEEDRKASREELHFYKQQCEAKSVGKSSEDTTEQMLLEPLLVTAIGKDDFASKAVSFLEANSGVEVCERLLKLWNSGRLRQLTQKTLALVGQVKSSENDKEHLRINLLKAEDEVNMLFKQNNILDEANKRLMADLSGLGEKHCSSASGKGNKRKSIPKTCNQVQKKIEFNDGDSVRQPLSPLQQCSSERRMHKK